MIEPRAGSWRLLTDDRVSAPSGLAVDDALARRAGSDPEYAPTLRLYTYESHCALIGRFQTVRHEVDVDACARESIAVNRRPTGGGAILMGADQLGVALTCAARDRDRVTSPRDAMARFSRGLTAGLRRLGIDATFRGKNDLAVEGRKIAGLGLHRAATGGLLFHASILVDLDVRTMLRVLRTPFETITEREIDVVGRRIATVRAARADRVGVEDVRAAIAAGFATAFGVELSPGGLEAGERTEAARLERDRYSTDDWVHQTSDVPDGCGRTVVRTPEGTLDVCVASAGRMLKAVHVGGDFIAPDRAVADLEGRLRWHSRERTALERTVRLAHAQWGSELASLPVRTVVDAVVAAAERAEPVPYGCFVSPEASR